MDALFQHAMDFFVSFDIRTIWGFCFGVLLLCGLGLPVPEDITLVLCGYMTYLRVPKADGPVFIAAAVLIGLTGVLAGDTFMFLLGRKYGLHLMDIWPFRRIFGHGRADKARAFLQGHGPKVLFAARFMPGLRSVVFFSSGTLAVHLPVFLFYDGMAALISVPALVLSSWYWGDEIHMVIEKARNGERGILIVLLAVAVLLAGRAWWKHRKRLREEAAEAAKPGHPQA